MYDSLIQSIHTLQKNKYSRGNRVRLASIQSALKLANPLFIVKSNSKPDKIINFRNIKQAEQIPRILDEFASIFESQCLRNNGYSAKNYSLFAAILLKIIKTLDADKSRSLLSAHAINMLNQMFAKYSVEYKKSEILDPLKFVFVIIELVIDIERNLSKNYVFDEILLLQVAPLMQQYYMKFDNTVSQILIKFSNISKFRLTASIIQRHKEVVQEFLQYAMIQLETHDKVNRATLIVQKIVCEKNDTMILEYYDTLKLCFSDKLLRPYLVQIATEILKKQKPARRFAGTILDEILKLQYVSTSAPKSTRIVKTLQA